MTEIFIAKGEKDVLTRTILEVGGEKYINESPYSDSDTLEMLIRCIEGYCASHGHTRKDIVDTMKNEMNRNCIDKIPYLNNTTVTMTVEQYSNRDIVTKEGHIGGDIITTLIECFIAVNVQATWGKETIFNWMQEYIDEYGEEETESEEENEA